MKNVKSAFYEKTRKRGNCAALQLEASRSPACKKGGNMGQMSVDILGVGAGASLLV